MAAAAGQPHRIILLTRQPDSYTSTRFAAAAHRLGLNLELADPHSLVLQLANSAPAVTAPGTDPFAGCAVIPRLGSLATEYSLAALRQLELAGAIPLNSYESLMRLRFKFTALGELATAGLPVPDTELLHSPADVSAAVERLGGYPLVLKFLRGNQGVGVVRATDESVVSSVLDALNLVGYDVMLQRYYPAAAESDLRVLVLNGEPRWAIRRTARDGGFRANFHLGGTAEPAEPTPAQSALAVGAARAFGLGFAGVDLIEGAAGEDLVLEVNGSPGFEAVDTACGVDVAAEVLTSLGSS